MRTEMVWRPRGTWAATGFLAGLILLVLMVLPLKHGSNILASHGSTTARSDMATAWRMHIQKMDSALGQGAIQAAEANWLVAHLVAKRSHTWEAWIGVGDCRTAPRRGNWTAHGTPPPRAASVSQGPARRTRGRIPTRHPSGGRRFRGTGRPVIGG